MSRLHREALAVPPGRDRLFSALCSLSDSCLSSVLSCEVPAFCQLSTKAGQPDRQTSLGVKVSWKPEAPEVAVSGLLSQAWKLSLTPEKLQHAEEVEHIPVRPSMPQVSIVSRQAVLSVFSCVFGVCRLVSFPINHTHLSLSCLLAWVSHLSSINQLSETKSKERAERGGLLMEAMSGRGTKAPETSLRLS